MLDSTDPLLVSISIDKPRLSVQEFATLVEKATGLPVTFAGDLEPEEMIENRLVLQIPCRHALDIVLPRDAEWYSTADQIVFTRFDFTDRTASTFKEKTYLFNIEREEQKGDAIGRLMQVIRRCISQKSWEKQGGSATIEWSEQLGVFHVKGPHDLHKRIEEFQAVLPKAEHLTSQWLTFQGLPDAVALREFKGQIVKAASIGPQPLESDEKVIRESAQWQAELDGIENVNRRIREETERELRAINELQSALKRN